MAHSKRDRVNEQRAKAAEQVSGAAPYNNPEGFIGADPGIEVGATTHGDPSQHLVGLLHEAGIDIGPMAEEGREEGDIVIHNAEQVSVMQDLERLIHDTGAVLAMAKAVRDDDESLYRQDVEWDHVGCGHAERWIDDGGNLGWRVGINFADASAVKFLAYVASKLEAMGWENVIAEAWGG